MKARIAIEVELFLKRFGIPATRLARIAQVTPNTLTRVLSGERQDMFSTSADRLRDAMCRLEREFDSTTTPTTSRAGEQEVPHE